jgi:23S rRNA (cytosine1962-C5)-methyltransferase
MAKVLLKPRKARPFWFGHPWVFSGAIDRVRGDPEDGAVVELCDHEGRRIGEGFFNSKSQIRVRVVTREGEGRLDAGLLLRRIDHAVGLRRDVLQLETRTDAYRVVHSEGDGLPGLVVDRLGAWLVVQVSCLGLVPFLPALLERLDGHYGPAGILERVAAAAAEEGMDRVPGVLAGEPPSGPVPVREDGREFYADPREGQKTGWYGDQRDNRRALAPLARGRRVLDAFCYSGAFGLRMLHEGADSVQFLDSSEPALELLRLAAGKQGVGDRIVVERMNALRAFDHWAREGRRFDLVVVDPPKIVHRRNGLVRGLRLYHEINTKALQLVEEGGVLVSCSCSQHVGDAEFEEMLASAAKETGVRLQEIHRGGQAPDHPVLLPAEEGRYLKCRALRVLGRAERPEALRAGPGDEAGPEPEPGAGPVA